MFIYIYIDPLQQTAQSVKVLTLVTTAMTKWCDSVQRYTHDLSHTPIRFLSRKRMKGDDLILHHFNHFRDCIKISFELSVVM